MKQSTLCNLLFIMTATVYGQAAMAAQDFKPWYVAADLGIFQGNYDLIYNDATDAIAQNIRQTLQQYGYNGGLAIGYTRDLAANYLIGAELAGYLTTNNGNFNSGSTGTAFSDQIKIQNYFDFVAVPGFYVTHEVAVYAKVGLSCASIKDSVNSPTGTSSSPVTTNSSHFQLGAALGLGLKKKLNSRYTLFTEFQYHDYGTPNLPGFQNFTANYSHSVHVYSQALMLGLSYAL